MCGVVGILNLGRQNQTVDSGLVEQMRDRLDHRGPDDHGIWTGAAGAIGHRRLSVIDTTQAGHQPMCSEDGRYVLAYNGELYNDHDLRSELASLGVRFSTRCDTETLLYALITWGSSCIERLRGMFAFAFLDTETSRLILARDPMGIKPLYTAFVSGEGGARQLLFSSEIPALLEHPRVSRDPDPVTLSSYLSTIRTTLGTRTLYRQINTLCPGDWVSMDLQSPDEAQCTNWWSCPARSPTQGVRQTIEESVHRHLRTDVPFCALLSGGLDSAITTSIARRAHPDLHTFCAGARSAGVDDDFAHAASLAKLLGTHHTEVEITQELFAHGLPEMIGRLGNPLSTPNEVAIYELARTLRSRGHVVAISGEGADELFGGYAPIMSQCASFVDSGPPCGSDPSKMDPGLFHLQASAWVSEELKPALLNPVRLAEAENDELLRRYYSRAFVEVAENAPGDSPLQAHLRFQRRINLPGLLGRLDTSTMLAGVEGRTPYADIEVAICAESLPMSEKYNPESLEGYSTKVALRRAFAKDLPAEIVARPKASFPLPFQQWMSPFAEFMYQSSFARQYFTSQILSLVCANPAKYWNLAWPMINLTLWGHAWVMGDSIIEEERSAFALQS